LRILGVSPDAPVADIIAPPVDDEEKEGTAGAAAS